MAKAETRRKIEKELENGDLGKARDRLHGLISSYPDDLELRRLLGDVYWRLQFPEMAGRYWYLEERQNDEMQEACRRFEHKFGNDPMRMLYAIRYKGDLERIQDTHQGRVLLDLHQKAQQKHPWYKEFQQKSSARYRELGEHLTKKQAVQDTIIKLILISIALILVTLICVGAITVLSWLF
jgi:hypothetical protein